MILILILYTGMLGSPLLNLCCNLQLIQSSEQKMSSSQAAELQTAIQHGNIEQSQMLARQLAEARAKVIVRIEDGSNAAVTPELTDIIRYNVVLDCFLTVLSIPGLSLVCLECIYCAIDFIYILERETGGW